MIKQTSCVITGSFDPFTVGHFCLVRKAMEYFDKVYILISNNPDKKYMFDVIERTVIIEDALNDPEYNGRVFVHSWRGVTVEWCMASEVYTIVRGIRDVNDMAYELNMARTNRILGEDYDVNIDTLFIPTYGDVVSVSSSLVRMLITSDTHSWYKYVSNPGFILQVLDCKNKVKKPAGEMAMA